MSNKNPPGWVDSIYQIKTTDRVQGGPNGVINAAPAQLAQRTEALKGGLEFATTLSGESVQFVGTFADGFTLKNTSQALSHTDGKFYVWHGQFDKVVPPGTSPENTGGVGDSAWVDVNNLTLRSEVAAFDGVKVIGRCPDISTLRDITPTIAPQRIDVIAYKDSQSCFSGGGRFEAVIDSESIDDGGSFLRVDKSWGWRRVINGAVSLHDFGADGTIQNDETAKNNAIAYCRANRLNLLVPPGTYYFKTPLVWNSRNHNIIGNGDVIFDFTGCHDGVYAISIASQSQSDGDMWRGITKMISGITFQGRPGIHAVNIDQPPNYSTPGVNFDNCLFNEFDRHVKFGNNEWICCFTRCLFRANSNGSTEFVVVDKDFNACENQIFQNCIFAGANSAVATRHIAGTCEITFIGCSFDYCHGVLFSINAGGRGIFRYTNCHFEDDGLVRQFDVNSGSAAFYANITGCDWYYVDDTHIPTTIGVFDSTNRASTVNINNCVFPIYSLNSDRKKSDLFVANRSQGNVTRFNIDGMAIESAGNDYFNVVCSANNIYGQFTEANLTSGLFSSNGAGTTVYTSTDSPPGVNDTNTWLTTSGREMWTYIPYNSSKRVSISGWLRRSTVGYYVEVRYFNTEGVIIKIENIGIPGITGEWVRFGQSVYPPAGTAKIRLGWRFSAGIGINETLAVNHWLVEQY